jgi:hypothetical protein
LRGGPDKLEAEMALNITCIWPWQNTRFRAELEYCKHSESQGPFELTQSILVRVIGSGHFLSPVGSTRYYDVIVWLAHGLRRK